MNLLVITSVLLGFSAVCYFLLSLRLLGGKREIGSLPLGVIFLIVSLWVLGGAIEMMATNYVAFSIGRVGHYLGTALIPVSSARISSGGTVDISSGLPKYTPGDPFSVFSACFKLVGDFNHRAGPTNPLATNVPLSAAFTTPSFHS